MSLFLMAFIVWRLLLDTMAAICGCSCCGGSGCVGGECGDEDGQEGRRETE